MPDMGSMTRTSPLLTYVRADCAVFFTVQQEWGGFSNMAGGYPLAVAGTEISSSEALYQACRFPHRRDVQAEIFAQNGGFGAKLKAKKYRRLHTRPDWAEVEVAIMHWCLQVKLKQNWSTFANLLRATGERPIVEQSSKDDFWGAKVVPDDPEHLVGRNVLGRLLTELRDEIVLKTRTGFTAVTALPIPDFLLLGKQIPDL
jgi:ribA/ribD-fused uncharacterized protein